MCCNIASVTAACMPLTLEFQPAAYTTSPPRLSSHANSTSHTSRGSWSCTNLHGWEPAGHSSKLSIDLLTVCTFPTDSPQAHPLKAQLAAWQLTQRYQRAVDCTMQAMPFRGSTSTEVVSQTHLRNRLPLLKFHTVTAPLLVHSTSRRWFLSKLMAVTQLLLVAQGPQASSTSSLFKAAVAAALALKRPSRAPSCSESSTNQPGWARPHLPYTQLNSDYPTDTCETSCQHFTVLLPLNGNRHIGIAHCCCEGVAQRLLRPHLEVPNTRCPSLVHADNNGK